MALGKNNNYDNNQGNAEYVPTVYSGYTLKNPNGVDPSALNFQYYRRMLRIAIAPMNEMKEGDSYPTYDSDKAVKIFLTPINAMIFLQDVEEFIKDPNAFNNSGVSSGRSDNSGLISISNGKELGVNKPQLIIRKIDENGNTTSIAAYQFNDPDYNRSLRNFNEETKEFTNIPHPNIEIEVLRAHLKEFIAASTYATAYSFIDADKKNSERIYDITQALGASKGGKNKAGTGTSFFDKNNSSTGNSGTPKPRSQSSLDDLADELEA